MPPITCVSRCILMACSLRNNDCGSLPACLPDTQVRRGGAGAAGRCRLHLPGRPKGVRLLASCVNGCCCLAVSSAFHLLDEAGYTCLVGLKGCAQFAQPALPLRAALSTAASRRRCIDSLAAHAVPRLPELEPLPLPMRLLRALLVCMHKPRRPPPALPRSGFASWTKVFDSKGARRQAAEAVSA